VPDLRPLRLNLSRLHRPRLLLAASVIALCVAGAPTLLVQPALAGPGELRGQEMSEGYGRMVLSFTNAPKTAARVSNGVLVVSFSEPSTVNTDRIMRDMPAYVSMARSDPDGRGLRFALTRGYKVNVTEAGEQIFIDLLPENWKGMLPGLPKEVVEELTRRARIAEIKAREASRQKEAEKPLALGAKASQTATLTRLLIDAPSAMPVAHRINGGQAEIIIDRHVTLDPVMIKPLLPEGAKIISAESGPAGLRLALAPPDGWSLRTFREDEHIVIDFVQPRQKASPEQDILAEMAKAQPMPPAKPAELARSADPAKPQDAAKPTDPAKLTEPAKPVEAARSSEAPKQALPAKGGESAGAAPAAEASADARRSVTIQASRTDTGARLDFDFGRRTGAAAFERNGLITLAFDTVQSFDPETIRKAAAAINARIEPERQSQLVLLRIEAEARPLVRMASEGGRWTLTLGENAIQPAVAIAPVRGVDENGQTIVSLPFADASSIHWITDAQTGEQLGVVTAPGPARGLSKPYRFVEFELLPTAHGVVVAPKADDVIVRSGLTDVQVSRNRGLMISTLSKGDTAAPGAAARPDQLIEKARWNEWRLGNVRDRLREQARLSAEATRQERGEQRLRLASMLLANDLASEAMGPLNALQGDDPTMRADKRALLMRGMAQALMFRDADAITHLNVGILKDDTEAGLWRALSESRLDRHQRALPGFRRASDMLDGYPEHLQALFRPELIRSAVAMREFSVAEREFQMLNELPREAIGRDNLTLLRALIDEASGRPDAAIQGYRSLFASTHRPVSAEAQLRGSLLALRDRNSQIPADEAIARLETVSVIWRGDELEALTLGELGRIYAEKLRWRDAFAVAKRANEIYPDHPVTRGLHDRTAAQFEELFATGKSDTLPRVEALALFYDFKEFLPIGRRGDEIIRRLSDRLVELDLLDQAADLLQHQIDKRLNGAARSTVAARLAMVRLMNFKPAEALAAIVSTRQAELPQDVRRARLLLEAKALSDLSRTDLALEILATESGPEVDRLRADIMWTGRRWREAGEAHERILGESWRGKEPLTERERRDVMRAGMAYVMADEALSLDRLRTKFAARMAETPDARSFAFVTGADRTRPADMRELARSVSNADTVSEFLSEYRKRYPGFSATNRKPQTSAAPQAEQGAAPPSSAPAPGAPSSAATPQAQAGNNRPG
jgi:tetratricopeptide (TPR) repeat protein